MKTLILAFLVGGLLGGCGPSDAQSAGQARESFQAAPGAQSNPSKQEEATPMPFEKIELSRSPCFGGCPVYSVTIDATGHVEYEGKRFVAETGKRQGRADTDALRALAETLRAKEWPVNVDYRPGTAACGKPVTTDMAGASITIKLSDTTRKLHYYKGCPNVPDWLPELAAQIDEAALSGRWVGGKKSLKRMPKSQKTD